MFYTFSSFIWFVVITGSYTYIVVNSLPVIFDDYNINLVGSIPPSIILKNTTLLRRSNFHLSPDNPFLQVFLLKC